MLCVMAAFVFLFFVSQDVSQRTRRRSWCGGDSLSDHTFLEKLGGVHSDTSKPGKVDKATKLSPHSAGTCKPCVFFASNIGCSNAMCRFCHLEHTPPSTKRPRKQMREHFKAAVQKVFEDVQACKVFFALFIAASCNCVSTFGTS